MDAHIACIKCSLHNAIVHAYVHTTLELYKEYLRNNWMGAGAKDAKKKERKTGLFLINNSVNFAEKLSNFALRRKKNAVLRQKKTKKF